MFDSRHDSTYRLYQSITAVKYMKPCRIGMYVMSELQTSSTRVEFPIAEQVGIDPRVGRHVVVRGLGKIASRPIMAMSRCTRLRLTVSPDRSNDAVIRRLP